MAVEFTVEYEIARPIDAAKQYFFQFNADPNGGTVKQYINDDGAYVEIVKDEGSTATATTTFEETATGGTKVSTSLSLDLGKDVSATYEAFAQQAVDSVPADQQKASMEKIARQFEAFIDARTAAASTPEKVQPEQAL